MKVKDKVKMAEKTIGIIGYGNMGSAIAERLKDKYPVIVFDKDKAKAAVAGGIKVAQDIPALIRESGAVILAVKPQDIDFLLDEIKGFSEEKLLISIIAGINSQYLEKKLGGLRIIRAMPNIGVRIGQGLTCLSKGALAQELDFDFAKELFNCMGRTMRIDERMMNAATAVSGSGPAYVCEYLRSQDLGLEDAAGQRKEDFLRDFQNAAAEAGFDPQQAVFLVENTFSATINFLKTMRISPEELIRQVASKGGTTEAALAVLHQGGLLAEAVKTALRRAEELSRKE